MDMKKAVVFVAVFVAISGIVTPAFAARKDSRDSRASYDSGARTANALANMDDRTAATLSKMNASSVRTVANLPPAAIRSLAKMDAKTIDAVSRMGNSGAIQNIADNPRAINALNNASAARSAAATTTSKRGR